MKHNTRDFAADAAVIRELDDALGLAMCPGVFAAALIALAYDIDEIGGMDPDDAVSLQREILGQLAAHGLAQPDETGNVWQWVTL